MFKYDNYTFENVSDDGLYLKGYEGMFPDTQVKRSSFYVREVKEDLFVEKIPLIRLVIPHDKTTLKGMYLFYKHFPSLTVEELYIPLNKFSKDKKMYIEEADTNKLEERISKNIYPRHLIKSKEGFYFDFNNLYVVAMRAQFPLNEVDKSIEDLYQIEKIVTSTFS